MVRSTAGWLRLLGAVLIAAILAVSAVDGPRHAGDGPPPERLARLARGVNVSHLAWNPTPEEEQSKTLTSVDVVVLKGVGLTHVRLVLAPSELWNLQAHRLDPKALTRLKRATAMLVAGGLAVVLDAHAGMDMEWTAPDPKRGRAEELERFWAALAGELAGTDPEWVFFEVLNEPHGTVDDGSLWMGTQEKVVAAIRAAAPGHTIVVTGDDWGSIDGLVRMKPLTDGNVVYSFHLYDPHLITHQGAPWGVEWWRHVRGLEYPARRENAERIAAQLATGDKEMVEAAKGVREYAKDGWDGKKIGAKVAEGAAWGKKHGVALYCGEFGAYRPFAPAGTRVAWIQDARKALEGFGIAWSMWEYRGAFGLLEEETGSRKTDEGVVRALGLRK